MRMLIAVALLISLTGCSAMIFGIVEGQPSLQREMQE